MMSMDISLIGPSLIGYPAMGPYTVIGLIPNPKSASFST